MTALLPVVLAGGSGTRLWPWASARRPKALQPLIGEQSLLEETLSRIARLPGDVRAPWILAGDEYRFAVAETARGADTPLGRIVLEPDVRGTVAAIAAAAYLALEDGFDGHLLIVPSDQHVSLADFLDGVAIARENAASTHLVTFGVAPRFAATGYGYVEQESPSDYSRVARFVEKPDADTAQRYLADTRLLWNSGMFLFSPRAMLGVWEARDPASAAAVLDSIRQGESERDFFVLGSRFLDAVGNSIDYAVMEHADDVFVARYGSSWSDVGTWDAVGDAAGRDAEGNVIRGDAVAIDSRRSLVYAEGTRVGLLGLEDVLVAATAGGVLVAAREREQDVRRIAERLPIDFDATPVVRPWGSYRPIARGAGFLVKEIEVNPKSALSLQQHAHRAEHWIVLHGTASVTKGDRTFELGVNESTTIEREERHRLANETSEPLVMIEVQLGDLLDEADIVRFEDDYGRQQR